VWNVIGPVGGMRSVEVWCAGEERRRRRGFWFGGGGFLKGGRGGRFVVNSLLIVSLIFDREIRDLQMAWQSKLVPDLEIPAAQHRCIDREHDSLIASFLRALDQAEALRLVLKQIQLQDIRDLAARLAHILQRARREAAQAHRDTLRAARSCRRDLAVRVCQALHCGWRHAQRDHAAMAEDGDAAVDP